MQPLLINQCNLLVLLLNLSPPVTAKAGLETVATFFECIVYML